MCGIFALLSKQSSSREFYDIGWNFNKIINRGPDNTFLDLIDSEKGIIFGFHRLSINDLSINGNQPLVDRKNEVYLICNGEIYNHTPLIQQHEFSTFSSSDCEVILHLYQKFGFEETIKMLDGVFAMVLYDKKKDCIYIARDAFGIRPMFIGSSQKEIGISSELKVISDICDSVEQFPAGCTLTLSNVSDYHSGQQDLTLDSFKKNYQRWYHYVYETPILQYTETEICQHINSLLVQSVKKRLMSDRPIGCLLSGGLDSSLISAIVAREFKNSGKGKLQTFSIGIKGSTDLKYAKLVADHIGSTHHTIELTEQDFLGVIPEVIKQIESYDTTTVRASVGNYLVGKYIKEHTDITVVYNGDGSDEQSGYIYLANAPSPKAFKDDCVRLLKEISYFDVLRSDRSISSRWSLESRTPFLDKDFVDYYMSLDPKWKMYKDKIEKYMLRKAFDGENLLPPEVLWRRKEAFSDGCSSKERSWHTVIQEYIEKNVSDEEFVKEREKYTHNIPILKESYYYRKMFELFYDRHANVIPHFWLPKWCGNIQDPSARELQNYNQEQEINNKDLI